MAEQEQAPEEEQVALIEVEVEQQRHEGNAVDLWAAEGTRVIELSREWRWDMASISSYCSACISPVISTDMFFHRLRKGA